MNTDDVTLSRGQVLKQLDATAAIIQAGITYRNPDIVALAALQLNSWLEILQKNGQSLPDKCNEMALEELVNETMTYLKASWASTIIWDVRGKLNKSELWKSLCPPRSPLAAR